MADPFSLPQFVMELTALSAENLKKPASCGPFSRHSRPSLYITRFNGDNNLSHNFTFGDRFLVPIDSNFFANNSNLLLQLHTKTLLGRQVLLGWCQIPAADIGEPPVGSVRHLSYKLRGRDGSMGNGIVDLQVKLESYGRPVLYTSEKVMGTPATTFPPCN
ncbi:hypothetical protein V6N13_046311 [Hibiscus sabdariffa]|uniref:C2 domain-containing protein n=1 Tax=Hibiscus sabdariffa TaxID=183260 RepID=A0ABR2D9T5_9ROSI